jgi:hypothetical protein
VEVLLPLAACTDDENPLRGAYVEAKNPPGRAERNDQLTIDFSDGQRLLGVLSAVDGNPDASQFVVTGVTVTPTVPVPGRLQAAEAIKRLAGSRPAADGD